MHASHLGLPNPICQRRRSEPPPSLEPGPPRLDPSIPDLAALGCPRHCRQPLCSRRPCNPPCAGARGGQRARSNRCRAATSSSLAVAGPARGIGLEAELPTAPLVGISLSTDLGQSSLGEQTHPRYQIPVGSI
ncbi:hypothetical protein ZWY2020_034165 [Hordeum vulgare]|nr:hypothetical protein ZWY2020_034165 [Hordeum vulgare]